MTGSGAGVGAGGVILAEREGLPLVEGGGLREDDLMLSLILGAGVMGVSAEAEGTLRRSLMPLGAGSPILDFSSWSLERKNFYTY